MDYTILKASIKEISDIASSVPEQFREKCFEMLLNSLLGEHQPAQERKDEDKNKDRDGVDLQGKDKKDEKRPGAKIPMTAAIRILMGKTGVTEEDLKKILFVEDDQVHFIHTPEKTKSIIDGQLAWSLLLALKNAILRNALETDPEEVRSKCQAEGFYDSPNFAANFKRDKFTKLYKGTLVSQGPAETLTTEGQDALGDLIKTLAGQAK
jgi:hypothetical protein